MNSHRQRAKRKTVTWQAAAIALLAACIGVGFLPLATMFGPGKQALPGIIEAPTGVTKPTSMGAGAVLNLAQNLKKLSGTTDVPPPPPPPPPPDETAIGPADPEPVAVANTDWQYVGHMMGPTFKRAIVQIGPSEGGVGAPQLSMGEGETRDGTKLVAIAADHIMVDPGDGNEKRIDLAARGAGTSWNTDPPRRPIAGRGMPGMQGQPGQQPGMMNQPGGFTSPNAAAMAEAQRRMKAAIAPTAPPMIAPIDDHAQKMAEMAKEVGELGQDKRDSLMKIMSDPSIGPEERGNLMRELGIPVDATPEQRGEFLEMIGVGPQNDPKLYEMLRQGGGAK